MKKSNKKKSTFLLFFIFLMTAVLTICSSYTLSKFTQTKNTGTITLEIKKENPVLCRTFITQYNLKTDGTTRLVFDSWDNQKAALGLTDEDWENNTNYVQEAEDDSESSENLRDGIKVFKVGTTAYVLAKKNLSVAFPIQSNRVFDLMTALESIEFNSIDTSNVMSMMYMFNGCQRLTSLDLSSFDTSKVINMSFMFVNCRGLTSLDVSSFDTSKVTDMSSMFTYCQSLTELDLSNFDTSNATTIGAMFMYCRSLTKLDVTNFDTSKVIFMNNTFNGCSKLTTIDLSSFDTSNVTSMLTMFANCSALQQITLGASFKFVDDNGYLPNAAADYAWYVQGTDIPLTPAEIAENQTTVTAATTYVQKQELTL